MALSIDSHAVLRAIADHPDAFPAIQPDLDDLARKMLGKQLKAKSTDAALLAKIYRITGESNFSKFLDSYQANDLAALVKKIDPFSPHAKAGGELKEARAHIIDIAGERKLAADKPEKPVKAKATKSAPKAEPPKTGGVLESKVHSGKKPSPRSRKST